MARKILLADDSVTAQNMGRKILADAGYEVITVNNGSAALKKIAELKPDLVVLDVYMPGYSGLEVCQRLKESSDSSRIPVLLTVGKLEPFKPEEAQRVRAEGYIVKPFEASELLSALSKLEDKVVPRAEPSKPGRFARAIASVEESSQGRSEFGEADDNGWKSRIAFPHKKTEAEKTEEKATDDASIYNPVNRDLRTVVESPAQAVAEEKEFKKYNRRKTDKPDPAVAEPTVDLAALASPELPQDVTPEEVAAIAAAAAQIKALQVTLEPPMAGRDTAEASTEPKAETATEPKTQPALAKAATPNEENLPEMQVVETPASEVRFVEAKLPESRPEIAAAKSQFAIAENAVQAASAPLPAPLPTQVEAKGATQAVAERTAAEAQGEQQEKEIEAKEIEAKQKEVKEKKDDKDGEPSYTPVTMAVANAEVSAPANAGPSQWTAISVALDADEVAMSLEHEMQKSYAAFVAEETAVAKFTPEPEAPVPQNLSLPEPAPAAIEAASSPEPEPVPTPSSQTETEPALAPELAVSPSLPPASAESSVPASSEVISAKTDHESAQPAQTAEPVAEAIAESGARFGAKEPIEAISLPPQRAVASETPDEQPAKTEAEAEAVPVSRRPFTSFAQSADQKSIDRKATDDGRTDNGRIEEGRKEEDRNRGEDREQETRESQLSRQPNPEEDPENVKTTAAAWASWRKIRDANDPKPAVPEAATALQLEVSAPPEDTAAMAVAAGAEHAPSDQAAPEQPQPNAELPGDVASIVDSLLADLRPKLLAEISRKMSEKK